MQRNVLSLLLGVWYYYIKTLTLPTSQTNRSGCYYNDFGRTLQVLGLFILFGHRFVAKSLYSWNS
jgi:hypothetical protein